MASLKYTDGANFQTFTLGASYTSGGTSITLTSGHGARLPSSGDFWIRVEDEIFKVTARSTDTLTVVGAQDGTSASNHSSGVEGAWVLSKSALDQLRTDLVSFGTFANLPASPQGPMLYQFTDSPLTHAIWNGSAWSYFRDGFQCTLPVNGDFAWINQGTASVVTTFGGVKLTAPGVSGQNMRIRKKSAPGTPYTITACFIHNLHVADFDFIHLGFRQSSDGKLSHFRYGWNSEWKLDRVNSSSPTADVSATSAFVLRANPIPIWIRITDDGTNHIFDYSWDGLEWLRHLSEGRTTYLATPDEVFFGADNRLASTWDATAHLIHWAQS